MNIFVFSSPLQYLSAKLVIKKEKLNEKNILGVYYEYQKDFSSVYTEIDTLIGGNIERIKIEDFKFSKTINGLFLTNRYNHFEIEIYKQFRNLTVNIHLYEEGMNFYIPHFFLNKNISDNNLFLKLKNKLKLFLGKNPSHLSLNSFSNIYSIFPISFLSNKNNNKLILNEFKLLRNELAISENSCIILSQWLVEHNFLTLNEYTKYIENLAERLSKNYKKIYFKPHPRDSIELEEKIFNIKNISKLEAPYNVLPAELVIANKNLDLFGFWSSTMFYVNEAWNNNVYSLFKDITSIYDENLKLQELYNDSKELLTKHRIKEF